MSTRMTGKRRQTGEAYWRELIARQAQSGQSIAAFCRERRIANQTFYWWRWRLGQRRSGPRADGHAELGSFIELAALGQQRGAEAPRGQVDPGIDIRLDLPGGISLSITRR